MTVSLVSKEEILVQVEENNIDWFENGEYFTGEPIPTPKYADSLESPELSQIYEAYWDRVLDGDLTPEERAQKNVLAQVVKVDESNEGDGNLASLTLYFAPYDLYVTLTGTYSSWDSTRYSETTVTRPYTYTETRYK